MTYLIFLNKLGQTYNAPITVNYLYFYKCHLSNCTENNIITNTTGYRTIKIFIQEIRHSRYYSVGIYVTGTKSIPYQLINKAFTNKKYQCFFILKNTILYSDSYSIAILLVTRKNNIKYSNCHNSAFEICLYH